ACAPDARRRYCLLRREETRRSLPGFSRAWCLRMGTDLRPFAPQQGPLILVHYSLMTAEYSLICGSVFSNIRIFSEFSLLLECKGRETGTHTGVTDGANNEVLNRWGGIDAMGCRRRHAKSNLGRPAGLEPCGAVVG